MQWPLSRQTSERCLVEFALAVYMEAAMELSACDDITLGCDGSSTCYGRSSLEVHVSFVCSSLCLKELYTSMAELSFGAWLTQWKNMHLVF